MLPGTQHAPSSTNILECLLSKVVLAFSVLHHMKKNNIKGMLVTVNSEKAFDRVSWLFLEAVLRKMGLSKIFVDKVMSIYSNQKMNLKINGQIAEEFYILNGTRQGCPLSPSLFNIYLEYLLRTIEHQHPWHTPGKN